METDFLVIGSGVAGLSYALKVAEALPNATVTLVTKGDEQDSNTNYAQGGIAVVHDLKVDSFEKHVEDTLIAGDYLCDKEVVDIVIKEGPERFSELLKWGASFDKKPDGEFTLGKEGGHSSFRILHHKDITGREIQRKLIAKMKQMKNITFLSHHLAIDLITEHHLSLPVTGRDRTCFGAYVMNIKNGEVLKVLSRSTFLASGGAGQVYGSTTNPKIATGDGIALAYRAKAKVKDMEFIQFHPTALYDPEESPTFLISEAVRGDGAVLRTKDGVAFMKDYDQRADLAPRDIVARAIDYELKKRGDDYVYLDCTHLDQKAFKNHFPNITAKCATKGIDVSKDMIPVRPAMHYLCGGIKVDVEARTSISRLYAAGECTCTGLHGANRLASNSLLEALVYSHRGFVSSKEAYLQNELGKDVPEWDAAGTIAPKEKIMIKHNRKELQSLMNDYVGIVRSDERLEMAFKRVGILYEEIERLYRKSELSPNLVELRNMINVSYLILKQSIAREENRGGFYNLDLV